MRTFTVDEVIETVGEIVKGREGYVYETVDDLCVYTTPTGAPSCIVGWWMDAVGVPLPPHRGGNTAEDEEDMFNIVYLSGISSHVVEEYLENAGVSLTYEARSFLLNLQESQDEGTPWGVAYELAVDKVRDVGLDCE